MKITKARLKQIIREELEESIRMGRRPMLQKDRPASDDLDSYDPGQIQLRKDVEEMGLGKLPHNPSEQDKQAIIKKIDKKLRRNPDKQTIDELRKLKHRIKYLITNADIEDSKRWQWESLQEELTRQDKTDVKKMVKDELEKLLKKKDTKDQMGEIVKKIMKKLYKDLSLEHPYIIDRIKI